MAYKLKTKRHKTPIKWVLFVFVLLIGIDLLLQPSGKALVDNNPKTTALIEARKRRGVKIKIPLIWKPLNSISINLQRAVIASEDSKFYSHQGVDWSEFGAAITEAFRRFKFPRGASTITQQLAKNIYLSESINPYRKVREFVITKSLEKNLSKKRILEIYLNVVEWGDGIYGVNAASKNYFGVSPSELTPYQASYLAAILPGPLSFYNPKQHSARVERRAKKILNKINRIS